MAYSSALKIYLEDMRYTEEPNKLATSEYKPNEALVFGSISTGSSWSLC